MTVDFSVSTFEHELCKWWSFLHGIWELHVSCRFYRLNMWER